MGRPSTAKKTEPRDAVSKFTQQRLSVIELARELGNVAEACRQRGLDRTSFYEWKRRLQTQGFEGLKDLPPIHKSHPHDAAGDRREDQGGGAGAPSLRLDAKGMPPVRMTEGDGTRYEEDQKTVQ